MKTSTLALTLFFATSTSAFVSPSVNRGLARRVALKMSESSDDKIGALRAAAAKAREEASKLEDALSRSGAAASISAKRIAVKESLSPEQVSALTSSISFSGDAVSQTTRLDELVASGDFSLWKSAAKENNLRVFPVSLQFLESRTSGKVNGDALGLSGEVEVSLDDFKYATLGITLGCSVLGVAALAFLPENIGATFCYFFALIPILFLGLGSTAPALIANIIAKTKGTADDQEQRFERICRHEAGHFMAGYLCGLPVKGYSLLEEGVPCVEFHASPQGDATGRGFSPEEIAVLSVVAMSGSVAEILKFDNAKGGENDLIELQGLFRKSQEFVGAQKQQDLTRWGALTAYQLLNNNLSKYDMLVDAFKSKKSVSECIALLESR
jgi:hypothetical protein